jgi:hypothetical protein
MVSNPIPAGPPPLSPAALQGEKVVAVDCAALLGGTGPDLVEGIRHASLADLDAAFLAEHQPSVLILPLFAASYDAMTAIELLEALHYAGRIAVLAPSLPKPRLVEAELRKLGPGTRLTLISPQTPGLSRR